MQCGFNLPAIRMIGLFLGRIWKKYTKRELEMTKTLCREQANGGWAFLGKWKQRPKSEWHKITIYRFKCEILIFFFSCDLSSFLCFWLWKIANYCRIVTIAFVTFVARRSGTNTVYNSMWWTKFVAQFYRNIIERRLRKKILTKMNDILLEINIENFDVFITEH